LPRRKRPLKHGSTESRATEAREHGGKYLFRDSVFLWLVVAWFGASVASFGRQPLSTTKTVPVLVSVPHGAAAGNLLRTGILRRLLEADEAVRVVLLSPLVKDPEFVREVRHSRVHFEDLPPHRPAGLEARLQALMQAAYLNSGLTESVEIRRAEALAKGTVRWIGAKALLAKLLAPSMVRRPTRYQVSDSWIRHPGAEEIFDRHNPVLLIVSSPGLIFSEVPLLRTAARRCIASMAIDPSWDNFTNKLLPVRRVTRLVVWNELMKEQAVDLHGYDADEVRIAGTPQWDRYFRDGGGVNRSAFFARIGADPRRKLITLTTTPRELYSHHDHVLRVLSSAIETGRCSQPAQVLVRLHPRDALEHYRQFEGMPHIIIEKPFRQTVRTGDGLSVDVTTDSQQHLADTMRHSDVIVNVASTISIEAAIFDTPVVNVAFDGQEPSEWTRSARRYYRFTHYVNITRHGAVRVAESPEQLIEYVGRYLDDPMLDREGRARVVREQCQFLDGRAAERVAGFVVDELTRVTGRQIAQTASCVELQASSR
ncbi:MAG TPA: CDP-glycerol glycerophosphotransferase family protein, partial [Vicinamibacterales bacterium]|nr:CDP-glycerol glycerophosphotransferase family protein [Vicinamibacterales bacterium]